MRAEDRVLARKNLDRRLNSIRTAILMDRPPRGWVKAIREALGMTAAQLASRIGVTRPRVHEIEKSEVSGSITLDSLERAAHALNCQLVYALVPRKSLEEFTQERALRVAEKKIRKTAHSMALEDQTVDQHDEQEQIQLLAKRLVGKSVTKLWAEE
jgi:predicted DNA-binding mobile mystery protein A